MEHEHSVILFRPPDDAPIDFYSIEESLGISYIASYLRAKGLSVEIVDAIILNWDTEDAIRHLSNKHIDVLGITLFSVAINKTAVILKAIKKANPHIHVNVGGQYPTFAFRELLENIPEIDSVTRHEGEVTFYELVAAIRNQYPLNDIKGIAFRNGAGEIIEAGRRPRMIDLDSLPLPARDTFGLINKKNKSLAICSSRGCWGNCGYCTINAFYSSTGEPKWVGRSANNVVDEIESLINEFGCNLFNFVDAEMFGAGNVGKKRVLDIANEIQRRGLSIKYSFNCRPEDVDEELFAFLKQTGLSVVFVGLESGSEAQLKRWNRGSTVEIGRKAINILRKLDIQHQVGFILYDPWTTMEELVESLAFIKELNMVSLPLFVRAMEIRPGMPLESRIRQTTKVSPREPFHYEYAFHDKRVYEFRKVMIQSLGNILELYKLLIEMRSASYMSPEIIATIESELTEKTVSIIYGLAIEIITSNHYNADMRNCALNDLVNDVALRIATVRAIALSAEAENKGAL